MTTGLGQSLIREVQYMGDTFEHSGMSHVSFIAMDQRFPGLSECHSVDRQPWKQELEVW